jgi:hypothetical protein
MMMSTPCANQSHLYAPSARMMNIGISILFSMPF